MKRFLMLAALLVPAFTQAQCVELKGFGGIMMNTKAPYATSGSLESLSRLNGVGGLGASYRNGRFEYGLSLSYRRYSTVNRTNLIFSYQFDPKTGLISENAVETTLVYKDPAFTVAPVFNYHFGRKKLDWYAGLSPSYIRFTSASPGEKGFRLSEGRNGWSVDAQLGAAYPVLPRLRVFAELQGGTARIPLFRNPGNMWTAGLNLGAQFGVWERKSGASAAGQ